MQNLNQNEPFYQISQAAKLLDISCDRLRTYEEEGLIFPYRKNNKKDGKRLYSTNDIKWLQHIRDLIKLGVTIPAIRILLTSKCYMNKNILKEKDIEIIKLLTKLKENSIYKRLIKNK